jgi:threonine dehydrogenase-like Zn-dependent dehydrogenase
MGHEFIGVVDAVGSDVGTIKSGDLVVSPFLWPDGSCVFCREGLQSACLHGGRYGFDDVDGGQGEQYASRRRTARWSCCRSTRTTS